MLSWPEQPELNFEEAFGYALQRARKHAHISQNELARAASLHRTYISLIERGEKSPTLNTIIALSKALDVKPHHLIKVAEQMCNELGGNDK